MGGPVGDPKRDAGFTGLIALLGVIAGVLLWIVTIVLSNSRLSGNGWSLSGNGALIVPFGIGREMGPEGLEAYLEPKHIRIRLGPGP